MQNKYYKLYIKKGFTLIEVLLSISILVIIAGTAAPSYFSFSAQNDLNNASIEIAQSLRRAQILSQSLDGDSTWGVYLQSGSNTIFKGNTYATRDSTFDEDFNMPTSIVISGVQEIIFNKLLGQPNISGSIILTGPYAQKTITINEKGMVTY